ncbi:MAG: hypothetical protein U5J98_01280 [Halobacteriales archaeon]|nr:hypothetical protein [Halobacteriales archaeon]
MRQSARSALLLSLLVVLAGCTAIGLDAGSGTPDRTATPEWPEPLPPGMTTEVVANPLDLARAHTAVLTGQSFTYRETVVVETTDGIQLGTVETVRRVAPDGAFVHRMRVEGVVPTVVTQLRAVDAYSNGSRVVIRFRRAEENTTLVTSAAESPMIANDVIGKGPIYSVLSSTEPTVAGPLRRGGTTYLHVRGDGGATRFGFVEATNVSFEALVAPSGLVHRYAVSYRANGTSYTGWEGRIVRTVTFDEVGSTTVERPDWVAEALPNATAVPTGR